MGNKSYEGNELEALGGLDGVRAITDTFYDFVVMDEVLQPLFNLDQMDRVRQTQYEYFVQIFGGEDLYSQKHGKPFLRFKHRTIKIGQPERDAWMRCFMEALDKHNVPQDLQDHLQAWMGRIADAMVNHSPDKKDSYHFN